MKNCTLFSAYMCLSALYTWRCGTQLSVINNQPINYGAKRRRQKTFSISILLSRPSRQLDIDSSNSIIGESWGTIKIKRELSCPFLFFPSTRTNWVWFIFGILPREITFDKDEVHHYGEGHRWASFTSLNFVFFLRKVGGKGFLVKFWAESKFD